MNCFCLKWLFEKVGERDRERGRERERERKREREREIKTYTHGTAHANYLSAHVKSIFITRIGSFIF